MDRRSFLTSALKVAVAATTVSYFDIGASYAKGLQFHPDAFAFLTEPCPNLFDPKLGIGIRFMREFDVKVGERPARIDTLYGWGSIEEEPLKVSELLDEHSWDASRYVINPPVINPVLERPYTKETQESLDACVKGLADSIDQRGLQVFDKMLEEWKASKLSQFPFVEVTRG